MAELGYPEVYLDGWFGIAGPAGLPDRLTTTIHDKIAAALTSPDLNGRLKSQGWVIDPIAPSQFRELIRSDMIRLGKVLKDADAKSGGTGTK
jgi:tripartite-type tricarboxylate transporter receptor subunit TctC